MKNRLFVIGAALVCAALAASPALAGDDPIQFAGWVGAAANGRYFNVSGLNSDLGAVGITKLSTIWPTLAVQARGLILEKMILGLQGAGSQISLGGGDGVNAKLTSFGGELDVGYVVVNGPGGLAYPFLGVGGAETTLHFHGDVHKLGFGPAPGPGVQPASVLNNATIERSVNYATIGFSYFWPVRFAEDIDGGFGMFLPGVTAGANLELMGQGWLNNGNLYRGPDLRFNNVFLQIEINFGGGTTEKSEGSPTAAAPRAPEKPAAPPAPNPPAPAPPQ
jgi:hypothetical protein